MKLLYVEHPDDPWLSSPFTFVRHWKGLMCQFGAPVHFSLHYGNYDSHAGLYSQTYPWTQELVRG